MSERNNDSTRESRATWGTRLSRALILPLVAACSLAPWSYAEENFTWIGDREYRLVIKVAPRALAAGREFDEMPAELKIDLAGELTKHGITGRPDVASFQVIPYSAETGKALPAGWPSRRESPFVLPFRWYDDAIPYDFPEFAGTVDRTKGKLTRRPTPRGGHFFNAIGDWKRGRLAWTHKQQRNQPSFYVVYFNVLPPGREPGEVPPRGWLGDGMPRCAHLGSTTMGADHCRVEVDDWNGDGLVDLIVGENYGHVLWWPNCGTKRSPRFPYAKFVVDSAGIPLDAGMIAAPKVVDWDGDGRKDLLVGTEWNRVLYFHNAGTNQHRKLEYRGFLKLGDQPLTLPVSPLTRGNSKVFKRDYYPILETTDWDGDGDIDLLAGGYVTGRIYFYANTGRNPDGTIRLEEKGLLTANGEAINVGHWCAAPCLADWDNDGDLDLISGNMPMYVRAGDDTSSIPGMLQYYENRGTAQKAELVPCPFPAMGKLPRARLATPRATDWDNDGDLDLVVSAREDIYLFENQGTRQQPRFRVDRPRLPSQWGNSPLAVGQFRDWDQDGRLDIVHNYSVYLRSRLGNPWSWEKRRAVLSAGTFIEHPAGVGDDWFWPYLADLDQDDLVDVLFGDWHGHVWFHRNQSTRQEKRFDLKGVKLKTSNGQPIKVGPIGKDPKVDFAALQGARTVLTMGDFDQDGLNDLVVGDTYGKIRYFRNIGSAAEPVFDPPVLIGDLGIRLLVNRIDWNRDGRLDVIGGAANGRVRIFLNQGEKGKARFAEGVDPGLPPIPQPRTLAADLNGDGDDDLFVASTQGSCLVERTFLERGYAPAELLRLERRKKP